MKFCKGDRVRLVRGQKARKQFPEAYAQTATVRGNDGGFCIYVDWDDPTAVSNYERDYVGGFNEKWFELITPAATPPADRS